MLNVIMADLTEINDRSVHVMLQRIYSLTHTVMLQTEI